MKVFIKKNLLILVVILLLVAVGGTAYYFYDQNKKTQELLKDPGKAAQKEIDNLVKKVDKLIELPKGEIPTVATVSDEEKLSGEAFFAKAKNGDKILIYTKEKKAILYRPSINKIIEVAPVTAGEVISPTAAPKSKTKLTATPTVKKTTGAIRVAIYNGTMVKGLETKYKPILLETITEVEVVKIDDTKKEYKKTFLVNLSGMDEAEVEKIADQLKIEVEQMPKGEEKPKNVDLLIILGENIAEL